MNANQVTLQSAYQNVGHACIHGCQKLTARLEQARKSILAEFRETFTGHEKLLRLALKEAEALAWDTPYPHLLFPTLATEKAQAAAAWQARQQSLLQTRSARPTGAIH